MLTSSKLHQVVSVLVTSDCQRRNASFMTAL